MLIDSDWHTWKVLDVATGKPLADELKWVKFSGASWTPDGKGFFYSRFPEPTKDSAFQSLNVNQKLYYHRLGTPQGEDVLVYHRPDQPKWAVTGIGQSLRAELREVHGNARIRVTLIEPGAVETPFFDNPGQGRLDVVHQRSPVIRRCRSSK